jgi:hypothetical protein
MKQWYEYQLANQVAQPELNQLDHVPVANLSHLCPLLEPLKNLKDKSYFRNFWKDANYSELAALNASGSVSEQQISDWLFNDPDTKESSENTGINYLEVPDSVRALVIDDIGQLVQASPEEITLVVNLQLPGQYLSMHVDRLKYEENGVHRTDDTNTPYKRLLMFMDDWQHGQAFQIGDNFLKWRTGDVYQWSSENVYHGSSNFGFNDRYVLRIDVNYPHEWRLNSNK